MTRFNIVAGNLPRETRESLTDVFRWLTAGLEENGHTVSHTLESVDLAAYNIFVDYFDNDDAINAVKATGAPYVVVSTEVPDGIGSFWNLDDNVWRERRRRAELLMDGATAIWPLTDHPDHLAWCSSRAPSSFLALGYTDQLRMGPMPREPYYDVLFVGSQDDRRLGILNQLLGKGVRVRYPGHLVSWFEKEAAIHSSAMQLDLRLVGGMPVPSYARIGRALNAGRVILQEYAPSRAPLSELAPMVPEGGDIVELTLELLQRDLRAEGIALMERYAETMPMAACMARALDETLCAPGRVEPWQPAAEVAA